VFDSGVGKVSQPNDASLSHVAGFEGMGLNLMFENPRPQAVQAPPTDNKVVAQVPQQRGSFGMNGDAFPAIALVNNQGGLSEASRQHADAFIAQASSGNGMANSYAFNRHAA
jgi:hypothetical protein